MFISKTASPTDFWSVWMCMLFVCSPFVLQWASRHWRSSRVLGMQGPLLSGPPSQWTFWIEEVSSDLPRQKKVLCHSSAHLVFSSASPPPCALLGAGQAKNMEEKKSMWRTYNIWNYKKCCFLFWDFTYTWSEGTVIFSSNRFNRLSMADILLLSSLIYLTVIGQRKKLFPLKNVSSVINFFISFQSKFIFETEIKIM